MSRYRWTAIAVLTTCVAGCADLLGLGDYRDLCKPYGIGDPPDCVYGTGASSSSGGEGGQQPSSSSTGTAGAAPVARSVSGTQSVTYLRSGGTETQPVDLTAFHPGVFVWKGDEFKFLAGTPSNQGSFTVDNVPDGDFAVTFADAISTPFVSSLDSVEGNYSVIGRPDPEIASQTTSLTLNISNMVPWDDSQTFDVVSFTNGAAASYLETLVDPPSDGAETWSAVIDWSTVFYPANLMTAAQGDLLSIAQLAPATAGGIDYLAAQKATTIQFSQSNGQTESVGAGLVPVAQDRTIGITWKTSAFDGLVDEINPHAMIESELFDIYAGLEAPDGGIVSGALPARMMEITVPEGTDVDGSFSYGNPYSANAVSYASFSTVAVVQVAIEGATPHPFGASFFTQMKIANGKVALSDPVIAPPHAPKVGGASFWDAGKLDSATPVVTWEAPTMGKASGYSVAVWEANVTGTRTSLSRGGTIFTTKTSLKIPSGWINTGTHVFFVISAHAQPGANFEKNPFRSTLPYAEASTVSDVFVAP